jgi:hypothetical protein
MTRLGRAGANFEDVVATSPTIKMVRFVLRNILNFQNFVLNFDNISTSVFFLAFQDIHGRVDFAGTEHARGFDIT